MKLHRLLFISLFLCCVQFSFSQRAVEIGERIEIEMSDGNKFVGTVTEFSDETISLQTSS